jgi:hypothetical protein
MQCHLRVIANAVAWLAPILSSQVSAQASREALEVPRVVYTGYSTTVDPEEAELLARRALILPASQPASYRQRIGSSPQDRGAYHGFAIDPCGCKSNGVFADYGGMVRKSRCLILVKADTALETTCQSCIRVLV